MLSDHADDDLQKAREGGVKQEPGKRVHEKQR